MEQRNKVKIKQLEWKNKMIKDKEEVKYNFEENIIYEATTVDIIFSFSIFCIYIYYEHS